MANDIKQLMRNPAFIAGLNMMAANRGTGTALGPAAGIAGLNTMQQLELLETESANRSYQNKSLELAQERNRLAQELAQKRMEMQQKQFQEEKRQAATKEQLYQARPEPLGAGRYFTPLHGVQGGGSPLDWAMFGGGDLMPTMDIPGEATSAATDPYQMAADALLGTAPPQRTPAPQGARIPVPTQSQGVGPVPQNMRRAATLLPADMTPQQRLEFERMRALGY